MAQASGESAFLHIPVDTCLPASIKKEMDAIFARVADQDFNRGPHVTFIQFSQLCYMLEDSPIDLTGKRCIDFGCGHERPFSIGALLHLAGAKTVMGIDFSPAASLEDVAFGVYSMLAYVLAKGCPANIAALGIDAGDLRRRIGDSTSLNCSRARLPAYLIHCIA